MGMEKRPGKLAVGGDVQGLAQVLVFARVQRQGDGVIIR